MMVLKNIFYYDKDFKKQFGDIKIENGKIEKLGQIDEDGVDCTELTALPGFIDTHIHGAFGGDFCDCSVESVDKISVYLAKSGVTSFCPTTMTLSKETLKSALKTGEEYRGNEKGAKILGYNLEGPYIALEKKGAQNAEFVRAGSTEEFCELNEVSKNNVKVITIAPEAFESEDFIKQVSKVCSVSVGHTTADFKQTTKAFENGANRATHLFNAMTPLTHREPGVVGASFDFENVYCELICDGHHINPAVLRTAFKILGKDRAVVVSDSMKAAGLEAGRYDLGGQDVFVDEKYDVARLSNGTIAASVTNVFQEFKNLLSFGIDFETALRSCTINPARSIKCDDKKGSIALGKDADLVVVNDKLEIQKVIIGGDEK